MHGNFSRDTYAPERNYSRVLMQQGCPITDADWNEQMDLVLQQIRALGTSVYDWYGSGDPGFRVVTAGANASAVLNITKGHCVIDGIVVFLRYDLLGIPLHQVLSASKANSMEELNIYLDVWEQTIQDDRAMHEASRFPRTARSTVRWALRHSPGKAFDVTDQDFLGNRDLFRRRIDSKALDAIATPPASSAAIEDAKPPAELIAEAADATMTHSPGISVRDGRYLYRVEIHAASNAEGGPTFKWSCDNALTSQQITRRQPATLTCNHSSQLSLADSFPPGTWIELADQFDEPWQEANDSTPHSTTRRLFQVKKATDFAIELSRTPGDFQRDGLIIADSHDHPSIGQGNQTTTPERSVTWLTRWMGASATHVGDGTKLVEATEFGIPLSAGADGDSQNLKSFLLDGCLAITFNTAAAYQAGNYWLIEVVVRQGTVVVHNKLIPVRGLRHRAPIRSGSRTYFPRRTLREEFNQSREVNELDYLPADLADKRPSSPPKSDESQHVDTTSLLSTAGVNALKQYIRTPQEILRRIPARYLNAAVTFPSLVSWLAPALVSEIANLSFEEFAEEVQTVRPVSPQEWPWFEREAQEVLGKAREFSRMMASNAGIQSLLR